jgi:hypothetical protein
MDNKFYIDDFERYLKEKADEFKMYPSKRVWNSIYNDMHPGSRWPSISMCIVLICTLFLVGFLNTNTTNKGDSRSLANRTNASSIPVSSHAAYTQDSDQFAITGTKDIISEHSSLTAAVSSATNVAADKNNLLVSADQLLYKNTESTIQPNKQHTNTAPLIISSTNSNGFADQKLSSNNKEWNSPAADNSVKTDLTNTVPAEEKLISGDVNNLLTNYNSTPVNYKSAAIEKNNHYETIAAKALTGLQISVVPVNTIAGVEQLSAKTAAVDKKFLEGEEKFGIEKCAVHNRPAPKKWKGKLSWQTYITPSVVYRSLENTAADKNVGPAGFINNSDINNSITHTPSIGIELGTGLQYDLSGRIKIKGGVQLNFTRYNAHAFDNGHPIATSLTMLSNNGALAYEEYRISPYNSTYGITPVKLHNQTYQVSLPIGADFKITAVDNLEWYVGATMQPSFILGGSSYLISTDRRNYVKESDLLNRFNLNAGFETYVAIKTKGLTWQIGPQFRKQIFSTNSKIYSVEERLMNYGLKIGITKKL